MVSSLENQAFDTQIIKIIAQEVWTVDGMYICDRQSMPPVLSCYIPGIFYAPVIFVMFFF